MDTMVAASPGTMTSVPGITFRSDVTVELVKRSASDADVLFAGPGVHRRGADPGPESARIPPWSAGLINYLMRDRHGSPFEHNSFTFFVGAPIFVFREFMRHRVGHSYNEESGQYRRLEPGVSCPAPGASWSRRASRAGTSSGRGQRPSSTGSSSGPPSARAPEAYRAYREMLEAGVRARGGQDRAAGRAVLLDVRDLQRAGADELPVAAGQERGLDLPVVPAARDRDGRRADGGRLGAS